MRTMTRALALALPGLAATASAQESAGLEEITVTARRVEESLQEVPSAITALSADFINEQRIRDVAQILEFTPGANFTSWTKGQQDYSLRGISSQSEGAAGDSSVATYVDNVMLKKLQAVAPNLSGSNIIGGPRVFSPLDIAGRNINNVGGSCHGGVESISQMGEMRPVPGWASHRMPIKGLYQTGNTTHPGGGVNAMAGRNAAWVVLDDLGTTIPEVIERSRTKT